MATAATGALGGLASAFVGGAGAPQSLALRGAGGEARADSNLEARSQGASALTRPAYAPIDASSSSSSSSILSFGIGLGALAALTQASRPSRRRDSKVAAAATSGTQLPVVDRATTKSFRKDLQRSEQYFKFGKTQMEKAMSDLKGVSGSDLVQEIRKNGFRLTIGDVTFVLAESYGFCWGVERAVAMAYEARNFFPDKHIWGTNEIIHNPVVNKNLNAKGINFIPVRDDGTKDFSVVNEGDVVLLPAFGASVDEMAYLKEKQVHIVDTTCPWVTKVWNSVEKSKDKGHTSIIHGKFDHEETIATKSFAQSYIVIKNMEEAEYLANYILGTVPKDEFMQKFSKVMSPGFDPDVDLVKVGVANQTTMLKGETELIGKLVERAMIKRYGPQEINDHYVSFNTICDATQQRQDAMYKMFDAEYEAPVSELYNKLEDEQSDIALQSEKKAAKGLSSRVMEDASRGEAGVPTQSAGRIDLCLVVGGFNSSNTSHLVEIAEEENVPAFHVDCAARIGGDSESTNVIQHKPLSTTPTEAMLEKGLETVKNWLPQGKITIGISSGASTPDSTTGECLERILKIKGIR